MNRLLVLAAAFGLAGCTLIDQRTFAPSPEAGPDIVAMAAPVRVDPRPPLVLIDYATPAPRYQELLRMAVKAAEARSGQVQYDVVAVLPDARDATAAQARAVAVMRDIIAEPVAADRVHLGMRVEPALSATQVRVYVR